MYGKYINLEFWFYQIYSVFRWFFNILVSITGFIGGVTSGNAGGNGYLIDSVTGYLVDPLTGYLIDPSTGFIWDPVTGYLVGFKLLPWVLFKFSLFFLTFIFFIWLVYSWRKTVAVRKKEREEFMASFVKAVDPKEQKSQEWQDIVGHIDTDNESQWKLAVIDADKILENLLRTTGYAGAGVGEMLKMAETQGGLRSLQDAWEAHKVRNRIAHETGFVLTKREAKRAIELYHNVFEELNFLN